ncbi:MAG: hypothetical protein QM756_26555 [Polyangiaceae bacterium]
MATNIWWGGPPGQGQCARVEHPRELRARIANPMPPKQPAADWSTTLTRFQDLCTASDFAGALDWLNAEYCYIRVADVPGGSLTALRAYIQQRRASSKAGFSAWLPNVFYPNDTWTTDGTRLLLEDVG